MTNCRPDGCAQLCTDEGLAAAHALYRGRLLARARRIVVDPHLAEEAVQEAFTHAWMACASFDPAAGPLLPWLLTITGNVSKDLVKARLRRPPLAVAPMEAPANHDADHLERVVLRAELRSALVGISDDHRTAVVETILRDRPYAEVASELGIKSSTLRTRVHYALRQLRTEFLDATCVASWL